MRKFLFVMMTVLACFDMQAQIVSSSSSRVIRIVEEKPEKPIVPFETKHYIKGGANVNQLYTVGHGDILLDCAPELPGFHLMYGMEKPFAQARWACLYWGFEAGGTMGAFSLYGDDFYEFADYQGNRWLDIEEICRFGVQITPKIGFKVGSPAKKVSFDVEVGLYANYNIGSTYAAHRQNSPEESETSELLMNALFNGWNNFESGVLAGIGYWIGPIYLSARYSIGLTSPFAGMDKEPIEGYYMPAAYDTYTNATHHNVYISLGIAF